ncbi:TfoX/Sxy family protein [Azospirillum canadense]|uniref:TfoX/Sxy family protein n=1 Tax=Azospirillum canadense TaxID=403962 RepID=UPI002225E9BC|nr:TfoX/Sxy family protein [Azospirillum canadense]MCW2236314.1 DNA transformation protein [Azospirillum canadense]
MAPAPLSDFVQMVCESLAPLGDLAVRRMFGGYGLYCDGLFFAIVADEVLYFKADEGNRADYEALGLRPFKPSSAKSSGDKPITLAYYPPPESALDEPEELMLWARPALAAAARATALKGARKTKPAREPV